MHAYCHNPTDDIVLISPSAGGLRTLTVFTYSVAALKLVLNVNKAKAMVFRKKRKQYQMISLSNSLAQNYKY